MGCQWIWLKGSRKYDQVLEHFGWRLSNIYNWAFIGDLDSDQLPPIIAAFDAIDPDGYQLVMKKYKPS